MSEHRSVISSAKLIGICTLASRVTGMVRDMLLMHAFALSWVQDAFTYAFQFPNLFRRLFGEGALAAVFVPAFTRTLEQDGRAAAWRLLARTLALLAVALLLLILAIEAVIVVIWVAAPGTDPTQAEARHLLLALTALMLPFMLTICVVALFGSMLNCVGSFVPAALTPMVLNVLMIGGILWVGPALSRTNPRVQVFGVAASVLVAGVVQLLFLLPALRANGVRLGWRLDLRDLAVRRMLALMAPVSLGQGVLLLGVFLDAQVCALLTHVHGTAATTTWFGLTFAYPLEEGALSAISVAQRLYQFPLGVLAISLAIAALPAFSRLATRQDWLAWTDEVRSALRMALFTGFLAGSLMIVLAAPIVRLLFEYRNFDAADTWRAARVLVCYGFGMWAFCAQHIILRAFYSMGDVVTPLKISCFFVPLNMALSVVLLWFASVREAAFGISTSVTSALAVMVGLVLLRRRVATKLINRDFLLASGKMLLACAVAAVVVVWIRGHGLAAAGAARGAGVLPRVFDVFVSLGVGSVFYLALSWILRLPEAGSLLSRGRARFTARRAT